MIKPIQETRLWDIQTNGKYLRGQMLWNKETNKWEHPPETTKESEQ